MIINSKIITIFSLLIVFLFTLVPFAMTSEIGVGEKIELPPPRKDSDVSVEEALWKRKSTRDFKHQKLTWQDIGQLLWAAQGINRPEKKYRTSPSAGATYPLELYVILPDGIYHYMSQEHAVKKTVDGKMEEILTQAHLGSKMIQKSKCVFLFSAVFERTVQKYGEAAFPYVYLEAGHAAQNLLLQAVALGLGGVPNGSILDRRYQRVLGLPDNEKQVYILVIGHPQIQQE